MSNTVIKTVTKAIVSEINANKSSKSKGTKIAVNARVLPIIIIEPFSR